MYAQDETSSEVARAQNIDDTASSTMSDRYGGDISETPQMYCPPRACSRAYALSVRSELTWMYALF